MRIKIGFIALFWILLMPFTGVAQEIEYIVKHDLGKRPIWSSTTIFDEPTQQMFLFLFDVSNTYLYILDEHGEMVNKYQFSENDLRENEIQSFALAGDDLTIISSYVNATYRTYINLKMGTIRTEELKSQRSELVHLSWYRFNGKCIELSAYENKNAFLIRTVDAIGNTSEKEIDLEDKIFLLQKDKKRIDQVNKTIISQRRPSNVLCNSVPLKIYKKNSHFVLTYDVRNETRFLDIDLNTLDYHYKTYPNNWRTSNPKYKVVSNSFILDDCLFQIKSSDTKLVVDLKDLEKDSLMATYNISYDEYSMLYDSDVNQFGGEQIATNKLIKLAKNPIVVKTITKGDIGISAQRTNEGYQVQFGGVSNLRIVKSRKLVFGEGLINFDNIINTLNLNTLNVLSLDYSKNRVTQISCLLNNNYEQKPGNTLNTVFDELALYNAESKRNEAVSLTLRRNEVLYGYYLEYSSEYIIKKFINTAF